MEIAKKKIAYNGIGLPIYERIEEVYTIDTPDYWTRLDHQAAIAAMQGMLTNPKLCEIETPISLASTASTIAHALVEKLKEKEERK